MARNIAARVSSKVAPAEGEPAAKRRAAERPRVLVVDDDDAVRALIVSSVGSAACTVHTRRNGEEALEQLSRLGPQRAPDLILFDVEMPVVGGRAFATRYRARPGGHAPIVVISGSADASGTAAQLGAVDVITKPFDLDVLIERVRRWVAPEVAAAVAREIERG